MRFCNLRPHARSQRSGRSVCWTSLTPSPLSPPVQAAAGTRRDSDNQSRALQSRDICAHLDGWRCRTRNSSPVPCPSTNAPNPGSHQASTPSPLPRRLTWSRSGFFASLRASPGPSTVPCHAPFCAALARAPSPRATPLPCLTVRLHALWPALASLTSSTPVRPSLFSR